MVTFERRLLQRFRALTVYNRFGWQSGIPVNGGKSISFRRMEAVLGASYAAAYNSGGAYASGPAVLTEGTPGAAMDATWTQVGRRVLAWVRCLLGPPTGQLVGAHAL